jgi:cellulose synthase/poly-beta-1,6-N-acetylglucosamine synthase-like glycosyltransferase
LLSLQYANLEVVVVNDGSKDETINVLVRDYELVPVHPIYQKSVQTQPVVALYRSKLFPNLVVVDKKNGGKADALNVALNISSGDLVCAIDADTLIEPDALQRMVRPFLISENVVAAGGTIRVVNECEIKDGRVVKMRVPSRFLAGVQVVEYLRAFLFGRLGWNRLGQNLIISGAFGLFRRDSLLRIGGYQHDTVGEDMELIVRLRRIGYEQKLPNHIEFIPDPVAWTEVPEDWSVLNRQRERWHRGLSDVLFRHKRILFNPRYGAMGLITYPYFVFVELLAPVIEFLGLLTLGVSLYLHAVNLRFALLFFLVAYGYGQLLSLMTVVLDQFGFQGYATKRDRALLVWWALVEQLGYRQFTVLVRLRGLWRFLRGRRDWGAMTRKGFATTATTGK